jgi:hypothetical protein
VVSPERVHLKASAVFAEAGRLLRARFREIVLAGLAVFVPLGLVEAVGVHLSDFDGPSGSAKALVIGGGLALGALALLGEVLYSGVVTHLVVDEHRGERHGMLETARALPYARLFVADILFVGGVFVGLVLLVVPGLIVIARFGLVAPVIEVEGQRPIAAFGRSRALTRRNLWRTGLILIAVGVGSDLLGGFIQLGISNGLGDSFLAEWIGAALAGVVSGPLFALPIVSLYLALAEPSAAAGPAPAPAATSSGTVTNR